MQSFCADWRLPPAFQAAVRDSISRTFPVPEWIQPDSEPWGSGLTLRRSWRWLASGFDQSRVLRHLDELARRDNASLRVITAYDGNREKHRRGGYRRF